jgi:hypothetical protein
MSIAADTHIQLGVARPKKSATVGTGAITLGANEVAIKLGDNVSPTKIQSAVGDLEKLYRFAKTNIGTAAVDTVFSIPPGGADNDIVTTGHTADLISLYVDAGVMAGNKSHLLHRTYKRLIERLLEEAK